jgi:hypothetical protein
LSDTELLARCTTILPGHRARRPAETFAAMAAWCEANGVQHDVYGEGAVVQDFERKVADLLGFEAAVFCISGTMTQVTALRLAAMERGKAPVALHPDLAHLRAREFELPAAGPLRRPVGGRPPPSVDGGRHYRHTGPAVGRRPGDPDARDRRPAVRLGRACRHQGPLPRERHPSAHGRRAPVGSGGRLWPPAGRDRGRLRFGLRLAVQGHRRLGGAMLLGTREFVARAAKWFARQGGKLVHQSPYVVAAAMQFDSRLASMPATASAARSSCTRCCAIIRSSRSIRRRRRRTCCTCTCR